MIKFSFIILLFFILHITHSSEDKTKSNRPWNHLTRKSTGRNHLARQDQYTNFKKEESDWANAEAETFVPQFTQENEKTKEDNKNTADLTQLIQKREEEQETGNILNGGENNKNDPILPSENIYFQKPCRWFRHKTISCCGHNNNWQNRRRKQANCGKCNKEKLLKTSEEEKEQETQYEPQSAAMWKLHEFDKNITLYDLQGIWTAPKYIGSFQVKGNNVRYLGYDKSYEIQGPEIQETHDQFIFRFKTVDWILKKHSTTLTWKKENEKDMIWYPMHQNLLKTKDRYYDRHYFVPPRKNRLKEKQTEREKEKEQIQQQLKEYFVSNLNAFIDYAFADNVSLDYLEIEIPGRSLVFLHMDPAISYGPFFYISRPDAMYETFNLCITGHTSDGSYTKFSAETFQLHNNVLTCELIDNSIFETQWQKIFKLNGHHTFKFKFYLDESKQNHKVMFGGQMFNFDSFQFDFQKYTTLYSCKVATQFNFFRSFNKNLQKRKDLSTSTGKECVNICEKNAGIKFKFTFYSSNDFHNIDRLLTPPNYLQKNINNFDHNFQQYFDYTNAEYEFPHNFNFENKFYYTGEEYQNFDLEQEFSLEVNDSFDQHFFFQDNIFDDQSSIVEDINFEIFEKQLPLSNFYTTGEKFHNFDLELEYFLDENDSFEQNSFFQDNIFN